MEVVSGMYEMDELVEFAVSGKPYNYGELVEFVHSDSPYDNNELRRTFDDYLTMVRNTRSKYDKQWAGVKRKLDLRVEYLFENSTVDLSQIVKEMHDAFQGELWIDGRLRYKDSEEGPEPFAKDPISGFAQIAWAKPLLGKVVLGSNRGSAT